MTFLESLSTPDIIYDTVLELLLLDFKNKPIKTNSSDLRHLIIEIPPHNDGVCLLVGWLDIDLPRRR